MTASLNLTARNGTVTRLPLETAGEELWSESAPRKLWKSYPERGAELGWKAWVKQLASRGRPAPLADLLPGRKSPLTWALPDKLRKSHTAELLEQLWRLERVAACRQEAAVPMADALNAWLAEAETGAPDTGTGAVAYGLEAIAWARALPCLAALVTESLWWQLWQHLAAAAGQPGPHNAEPDEPAADDAADQIALAKAAPEQVLAWQLLGCELPLCLA